jgi:hypothetical protein
MQEAWLNCKVLNPGFDYPKAGAGSCSYTSTAGPSSEAGIKTITNLIKSHGSITSGQMII